MPTPTSYVYSITNDFPGAAVNTSKLADEIRASAITIALDHVSTAGDALTIQFKDALPPADKTLLDGDTTGPAGGLIAVHDNTPTVSSDLVEVTNSPNVVTRKPTAGRAYIWGVDFADRKTWFVDSVKVTDEAVGTGDGVATVFALDHGAGAVANEAILDLTRGRITDDHLMKSPDNVVGGYAPVVSVAGVVQTMREAHESSGGDYTINFDSGEITFFAAPANGAAITATYYYVPASAGPKVVASPPAGKKWTIDKAEAQITADFVNDDWFTDTILMNVFYKPLGIADPANEVRYYNYGNLLDYAAGAFVDYPAVAGARGLSKTTRIFRWEYLAPVVLTPDYELRAWTKHQRALNAVRATVVMYAIEEDL